MLVIACEKESPARAISARGGRRALREHSVRVGDVRAFREKSLREGGGELSRTIRASRNLQRWYIKVLQEGGNQCEWVM